MTTSSINRPPTQRGISSGSTGLAFARLPIMPNTGQTPAPQTPAQSVGWAAPLCPAQLTKLSENLNPARIETEIGKAGLEQFIHDTFECLEKNTRDSIDRKKWDIIKKAPPTHDRYVQIQTATNPGVHFRFDGIPLVRNIAIQDPDGLFPYQCIHANKVDLGIGRKFIASQRPRKTEIPTFWKTLHAQFVPLIIDLTGARDALEGEKDWENYCSTSIPDITKEMSPFSIVEDPLTIKDQSEFAKNNIKQQNLIIRSSDASHPLTRIKFRKWPADGVVAPDVLIGLADLAESLSNGKNGPILIHGAAGVGRTGTLMSFMAARELLNSKQASTGAVPDIAIILRTVLEVVAKGRIDRGPGFVKNKEQFALIVEALKETFGVVVNDLPQPSMRAPTARGQSTVGLPQGSERGRGRTQPLRTIAENFERQGPGSEQRLQATSDRAGLPEPVQLQANVGMRVPGTFLANLARAMSSRVSELWTALRKHTLAKKIDYLAAGEVDNNGSNIPCPRHSAVSSNIANDTMKIHANHVSFAPILVTKEIGLPPNNYIAGQSPSQFAACERLLFKAIESRQGIFQLVSEQSQQALTSPLATGAAGRPGMSVIRQLLAHDGQRQPGTPLMLGRRFEVVSLNLEQGDASSSTYLLTVKDKRANDEIITIPLTQTGLKFDGKVLNVPEIVAAKVSLTGHMALSSQRNPQARVEPIIVSHAGVGRNATLMVYREIEALIESEDVATEEDLYNALLREITTGREARGPGFVHSKAQLQQLWDALAALLPVQQNPLRSSSSAAGASAIAGNG